MSESETFLKAICENPDEDGPRLIYADWLEDNGDPERAEFIRVQCALAQMTESDPQFKSLQKRERELFEANWLGWVAPTLNLLKLEPPRWESTAYRFSTIHRWWRQWRGTWPPPEEIYNYHTCDTTINSRVVHRLSHNPYSFEFRRGLIESVHYFPLYQLDWNVDPFFQFTPMNELYMEGWYAHDSMTRALLQKGYLGRVRSLSLRGCVAEYCQQIIQSPSSNGIKKLELCQGEPSILPSLGETTYLQSLTDLNLQEVFMSTESLGVFVRSPLIRRLKALSLIDTGFTDDHTYLLTNALLNTADLSLKLKIENLNEGFLSSRGKQALVDMFGDRVQIYQSRHLKK